MAVVVPLFFVDLAFLAANMPKIPHGGWFPLLVGVVLVVQMTTWRHGRAIVARILHRGHARPTTSSTTVGRRRGPRARHGGLHVQGPGGAAGAGLQPAPQPRPAPDDHRPVRASRGDATRRATGPSGGDHARPGVHQIVLTFGYMDPPDVLDELRHLTSTARRSTSTGPRSSSAARPSPRYLKARCRDGGSSSSSSCTAGQPAPPASTASRHSRSSRSAPRSRSDNQERGMTSAPAQPGCPPRRAGSPRPCHGYAA